MMVGQSIAGIWGNLTSALTAEPKNGLQGGSQVLVFFKQACSDVADGGFGNQGIDELKALCRKRYHVRSYCRNLPLKPILRLIRCLPTFTMMPVGT